MEGNRFETFKLATQSWEKGNGSSYFTIFLLILILLLVAGFLIHRYMTKRNIKNFFTKYAKSKGLTEEEIEILWTYAKKMQRDPMLVIEFKDPFEKAMDLFLKENPSANKSIVENIRKKLDLDTGNISPYVPLISTKDIEVFQNGKLVYNHKSADIALYEKDENYMYWWVIDNHLPFDIKKGDEVKIVFIRNEDGIYNIVLPVEDVSNIDGKLIVKLPHTFKINRYQRREYARVKIHKPVMLFIKGKNKPVTIQGYFDNISAGGGKICFDRKEEILKRLKNLNQAEIRFTLENKLLELDFRILEKEITSKYICIKGAFENIDDRIKDEIMKFVQKEQIKQIQLKNYNG